MELNRWHFPLLYVYKAKCTCSRRFRSFSNPSQLSLCGKSHLYGQTTIFKQIKIKNNSRSGIFQDPKGFFRWLEDTAPSLTSLVPSLVFCFKPAGSFKPARLTLWLLSKTFEHENHGLRRKKSKAVLLGGSKACMVLCTSEAFQKLNKKQEIPSRNALYLRMIGTWLSASHYF